MHRYIDAQVLFVFMCRNSSGTLTYVVSRTGLFIIMWYVMMQFIVHIIIIIGGAVLSP
jgi:hypothetical protein